MKRLLMAMMLMPLMALADTEVIDRITWTYTVTDGKAQVGTGSPPFRAISAKTGGEITVPSSLGGCPVTSIGSRAFEGCTNLTSVTIPSSVMHIGDRAFSGCIELKSVTMPTSLTNVVKSAFGSEGKFLSSTNGMTTIVFKSRRDARTVLSSAALSRIFARVLPGYTFKRSKMKGCRVDRVSPNGFWTYRDEDSKTNEVSWSDFYKRYPASFKEAIDWFSSNEGTNVLGGCRNRVSFLCHAANVIEESCPDVSGAKEYCAKLRSQADELTQALRKSATVASAKPTPVSCQTRKVNDDKGTETIGGIIWQYELVDGVAVVGSVDGISKHAAANDAIGGNVRIPARLGGCEVGCIGPLAFLRGGQILSVTIPKSVTNISESACKDLGSVKSVEVDPENRFYRSFGGCLYDKNMSTIVRCPNVSQMKIPEGVKCIGPHAFENLTELANVDIPSSVVEIGECAFCACLGLESVSIPQGVTNIGHKAFVSCKSLKSIAIPSSVKSIGIEAFSMCWGLRSVVLMPGVESIGLQAFIRCPQLAYVRIPSSVRIIGRRFNDEKSKPLGCNVFWVVDERWYTSNPPRPNTPNICEELKIAVDKGDEDRVQEMLYRESLCADRSLPGLERRRKAIEERVGGHRRTIKVVAGNVLGEVQPKKSDEAQDEKLASGAEPTNVIKWTYEIVNGGVVLGDRGKTAVPKDTSGDLVIPEKIDGKPVRGIRNSAFEGCRGLAAVTIPSSVASVGKCAFKDCRGLKSVMILGGVTSIGADAFSGCIGLADKSGFIIVRDVLCDFVGEDASVTIPSSVSIIGESAFDDCRGLTSVTIPSSVTSIGNCAFAGCSGLKSVTVPSSVTNIGQQAFGRCRMLTAFSVDSDNPLYCSRNGWLCSKDGLTIISAPGANGAVTIPSSVTNIGPQAFLGCGWLKSVTISEGVTSIGEGAFWRCSGLASVTIPSSVTSIGNCAFEGCTGLISVTIPSRLTNIGESTFSGCSGLTTVTIPSSVTDIGIYAFMGCSGLKSVTIPSSVTSIGWGAFEGCSGIKTATVPGRRCGIDFSSVTNLAISEGVTSIGYRAFYNCSGLKSVTIPSSVTNIGDQAFSLCRGLKSITIPSSVTSIGSYAFSYTPFYHNIPGGMVVLGGGVLYEYKGKCPESVAIPSSVTSIGKGAFHGCSRLKSITIPSSVTSIGEGAFGGCWGIKSMTIPSSVTSIGDQAFMYCSGLKSVTIPSSVTSIGERAFMYCSGLKSVTMFSNQMSIKGEAFGGCKGLVDVDIRGCGVKIAKSAFCGDTPVGAKMPDLSKPVGPIHVGTGCFKDEWLDPRSCVRWSYTVCNDLAQIDYIGVLDGFSGYVEVPEYIDGRYVEQNKKLFELLERMPSLKEVSLNPSNSNFVVVGGLVCDKDQGKVVLCPRGAREITLPENVKDVSSIFDYSSDLRTIRVAPGNGHFTSRDGVLYDKDMTTLIRCPNAAKKVDIPGSTRVIGKRAFCGCKALSEVRIPDGVTEIQASAFSSCTGLCSVVLPKNLTRISQNMFSDCTSLKSITLPQSVRKIDWRAFAGCSSLQSVAVDRAEGANRADEQAMRVEDDAFLRCGNLASIDLPGPDVMLFDKPLGGCTNLTALSFLPRMQHIWTGALKDTGYYRAMSNGTPIVFNSRLMGVKEPFPAVLEIPSGVVEIAEAAFSDNKDLKSVVIPASVTNIGSRAFAGCSQLETMTIPESVARIGYDSFSDCTNLKTVITATDDTNRVARMEKAFGREMKVLESGKLTVLPKREKTRREGSAGNSRAPLKRQMSSERVWRDPQTGIEWRFSVFKEEASLGLTRSANGRELVDSSYAGDLVIPEQLDGYPVVSVHDRAFEGCTNLTSICIPRTVGQFRVQLSSFVSLTNVTVDAGNARYRSRGRFLTSDNGKVLCDVCAGGVKSISIPDGIEEISWGCFRGAYWIEDVRIPSSVWSVGAEAFSDMRGLAQKHDPDNRGFVVLDGWLIPTAYVKRRKLTVPDGVRHIAHVGSRFSVWPDVYEVELPEGLETIGEGVFSGGNIETIEFPKSLKRWEGFGKKWHLERRLPEMKRPLRNVIFNSGDVWFSMPDSVQNVTFAAGVTDIGVPVEGGRTLGSSGGKGVKTVVLPAGLRSIHSRPDFPELTEIPIPSSVTNIGKAVFEGCKKLKSVGVEKNGSVELVPIDEFRRKWNLLFPDGCLHLTDAKTGIRWIVRSGAPYKKGSVCTLVGIEDGQDPSALTIPETIAGMSVVRVDWDYFLQSKSRSWRTEATSDAPPARTNVLSAVELRIPRTLEYVDLSAVARIFPNLQSLVVEEGGDKYSSSDGVLCESGTAAYCPRNRKGRVVLGEGIWRIGRAFSNCTNLTEVVLPASLRAIDSGAFSGCSRLEKLHLPEGLRSIRAGAFDGCVKLFEKSKRYDGFYVLDGWAINPLDVGEAELGDHDGTLVLPDGLHGIADDAFSGCANLLSVAFPKSLTYIGDSAFAHTNIRTLELPEGVRSVGYRAFWGCTNLMSVSIPSSIGEWDSVFFYGSCGSTFAGCTRLKSVHLAEGLRVLPHHGFSGCSGLESVAIPSSVTNDIGRFGSTAPSDWFSSCPSLREVCVSPENPRYKSIDGVVYAKDGKSLLCCPDGKRSVAIPDGVEIIGDYAFDKCSAIETIELPMSVTNIWKYAFYGCSGLKSVTIPEGVKQIGDCAFGNCRRLTEIRMPSTVREIGLLAFEGDSVPERILTAPGDAERILGLALTNGHSKLARMRSFQARYGRQSKDAGHRQESRFVVEGDALVRTTSGFARWRDPETGIAWLYSVQGDDAVDVRTEFLEGYKGHLEVPAQLGGKQVSGLLGLYGGGDVTSLSLPMSVTNINAKVLASCTKLKSVKMNVDGELKTIGIEDLRKQWGLSGSKKPALHNLRKGGSLRARRLQRQQEAAAAREDERRAQAELEKAQREQERAEQRRPLLAIQEELRKVRAAKQAAEAGK